MTALVRRAREGERTTRRHRLLALVAASALAVSCSDHGQTGPSSERRMTAPPAAAVLGSGRLVAIGAHRTLYLTCVGSGRPTVVLEAGFPGDSQIWRDVQPQLGRSARTCAYDRAGLGNSLPRRGIHDAADEVADLRRLLRAARLPGPYVLVGHSYGGMLTELFAHEHADDTAGVVLVDARGRDATRRQLVIWPRSAAPSVRRAVFRPVQDGVDLAAGEALARKVRTLGDTPLAVVTAGTHEDWHRVVPPTARALDRLWTTMQDELAELSSDHVHVVAVRSDHFVQQRDGQPDVVIRAVRAVVCAARIHGRLPPCRRLFSGDAQVRCRE